MTKSKKRKQTPIWSPRSKASLLKQADLSKQLQAAELQVKLHTDGIARRKADADRLTADISKNASNYWQNQNLTEALAEIQDRSAKLKVFKKQVQALKAEIDALEHPTRAAAAKRLCTQNELADLVRERQSLVGRIGVALSGVSALLDAYTELSAAAKGLAQQIDLPVSLSLDGGRFDGLKAALPDEDFLQEAQAWALWFLGKDPDSKLYTLDRSIDVRETLVRSGVHKAGEKVRLTLEEAQDAGIEARPKPPKAETVESVEQIRERKVQERFQTMAMPPPAATYARPTGIAFSGQSHR